MNKYKKYQAILIDEAIDYQLKFSNNDYSYSELCYFYDYFYKNAKRYGLIKEFRENGII